MVDLLRSLEWQAGYNGHACPSCRACEVDGHTPTCRLARAIRELADESPGEPLDIPATAAFIRDHVAIADRVLGPVVDGPAICPPPRTTRPILPPEPTVDEMAREMGLVLVTDGVRAHWADRETGAARIYWSAEKARATHFEDTREWLNESDAIRTLYREHKARQIDATIAGKRVSPWLTPPAEKVYEASMPVPPDGARYGGFNDVLLRQAEDCYVIPIGKPKPPTDPSALAAWLYVRVGHGTWAEWVVRGNPRPSKEAVTGCDLDDGAVWLDLATSGRARIPGEPSDRLHVVRLLNPDGTVLWEQK